MARAHVGLPIALVSAVTLVAGCGQADQAAAPRSTAAVPSPSVAVPDGVSLTKPGTTLGLGEGATVAFAPTATRGTVLRLAVTRITQGRPRDLAAYDLVGRARRTVPYYVSVQVRNLGPAQIGRSAVPLWALSSDDSLVGSSGFTNSFTRCPSRHLPARFGPGRSATTCLMYLLPRRERLEGVSFRPVMAQAPVVWKGAVSR